MDSKLDALAEGSDDQKAESDGEGPAGSSSKGATRTFTPEELEVARKQVDKLLEQGEGVECSVSGPLTVRGVEAAAELPDLAPAAAAGGSTSSSSRPPRKKSKRGKAAAAAPEAPAAAAADGAADVVAER